MEKKNGQKLCDFSSIYNMKEEKDIPLSVSTGMSREWYVEFYTVACHILKDVNQERYNICYSKLKELVYEAE